MAMDQRDFFDTSAGSTDVLGDAYCRARSAEHRRAEGITLTPDWLVALMVERLRALDRAAPVTTVVDAGAGSGRFALAAARALPQARVVAVERSAEMLELLRRNVGAAGLGDRVQLIAGDFRDVPLVRTGRTVFIGNPPFVRHHDLGSEWKAWYARGMSERGIRASQLAGLHAHFVLRMAQLMQSGDALCLVAAAEWLDNGYGAALRALLTRAPMALTGLWVAPPQAPVFPDALVSAAVFEAECRPDVGGLSVALGKLTSDALSTARSLQLQILAGAARWTPLCQPELRSGGAGVEVGELFRVLRGQVTGSNAAWIVPADAANQLPGLTVPAVTRAREIIDGTVCSPGACGLLRHVVDLPDELDSVAGELRGGVRAFLDRARALGAATGYVARQRRHWHAVAMRAPPDAFVSYMGRRPPVFRPNPYRVSYINIAHGLYAREALAPLQLERILSHLNQATDLFSGRVYGGGLAKFEPSDIARLRIPEAVFRVLQ